MLKIGLTGFIGSGKSTVAKVFEALNVPVFYSDAEAKKIINNDKEVITEITKLFGEEAYKNSIYQTAYIATKVFNDSVLLEKLNAIVHPKVAQYFENWCTQHNNAKYVLKESALIFQLELNKKLDAVIIVNANKECILSRVMRRDNISREQVEARLNKQLSSLKEIVKADYTIENNSDSEILPQVLKIHEAITARAN